jgi:hypothetical protein
MTIVTSKVNHKPNMQNAVNFLIHHFPILYFQGCVAHCLNLLLKDWGIET